MSHSILLLCALALLASSAPIDIHCFHGSPCAAWDDDVITADGLVDISGLDLPVLVHELWKHQIPAIYFAMTGTPPPDFDPEQVEAVLGTEGKRFDYISGRAIKLTGGERWVDPRRYDEQAGEGTMARVVAALRAKKS